MRKLRSICGVLAVTLYVSAASALAGCNQTPPEYREFLRLPREQQLAKMRKLPLDKQIDYYLAGRNHIHPPLFLGDEIASRGKEAVPFLVKRLREEKKDYNKLDLIYLFRYMHRFHYDLKDEKEALELLKDVAAKMEAAEDKTRAQEMVTDIIENRPAELQKFKERRPEAFPQSPRR